MHRSPSRSAKLAAALVPPLTVLTFLYQVIADLQITVLRRETLVVCLGALAVATAAGVIAALGGRRTRAAVLALTLLLWVDLAVGLGGVFAALSPDVRALRARDEARVADLGRLQQVLERYIEERGPLPGPAEYGEGTGPDVFWRGWWDVSSADTNGDGTPFLDFLVAAGLVETVPVDPVNRGSDDLHPGRGMQYVFTVIPAGYPYEGGVCDAYAGRPMYLLAASTLEGSTSTDGSSVPGSGCACVWRDRPGFFDQHFDYLLCGPADRPESTE